jgi:hypothetical protein
MSGKAHKRQHFPFLDHALALFENHCSAIHAASLIAGVEGWVDTGISLSFPALLRPSLGRRAAIPRL